MGPAAAGRDHGKRVLAAECERAVEDYENGAVVRWVLCLREDPHRVIGRVNYTQIARGPFQSCMLGYAIDAGHEGRGLMREALEATIEHVFAVLRLHRIQANYVPDNQRSGRLLERLGFVREGLAKNYLYINGAWRDHVLTARLNPAFDTSIFTPGRFDLPEVVVDGRLQARASASSGKRVTSTESTLAAGGPRCAQRSRASSWSSSPTATASTRAVARGCAPSRAGRAAALRGVVA